MKQLDCDSYEFASDGEYYGLISRSGFGWVASLWVGPAKIEVSQPHKTPEASEKRALELLSELYARVKP